MLPAAGAVLSCSLVLICCLLQHDVACSYADAVLRPDAAAAAPCSLMLPATGANANLQPDAISAACCSSVLAAAGADMC